MTSEEFSSTMDARMPDGFWKTFCWMPSVAIEHFKRVPVGQPAPEGACRLLMTSSREFFLVAENGRQVARLVGEICTDAENHPGFVGRASSLVLADADDMRAEIRKGRIQ